MKISTETVQKLIITDVPDLDPVAVYLEDQGVEKGKATITCFNDSWSYFWGAMGKGNTIRSFILKCDEHYLAGKFIGSAPRTEPDPDKLEAKAKRHILDMRKDGNFSKHVARELWSESEGLCDVWHEMNGNNDNFCDAMYRIFGHDWYDLVPTKPHYQYEYLCRIINTVKAALQEAP